VDDEKKEGAEMSEHERSTGAEAQQQPGGDPDCGDPVAQAGSTAAGDAGDFLGPVGAFAQEASGGKVIDIRRQVEARAQDIERKLDKAREQQPGGSGGDGISDRFVLDCLRANALGDGVLYTRLFRDRFLYVNNNDTWLNWSGHHWDRDINNQALIAVESVAQRYMETAKEIDPDDQKETIKALHRRATRLRGKVGRSACLEFSRTNTDSLAITGDELDCQPWLLPCKNGVIDLRTGKLERGRPGDYLMKACDTEYHGLDADAPPWDNFLLEVWENNTELYKFAGRMLGCALVGRVCEHVFPVLTGEGRNGKTVLIETLKYVLGDLAGPIQSAMLLDQGRVKNSAGPSPDIMTLKGLRLAFASETDEGCRISPSRVKWLTGGDTLVGREPNAKHEVFFAPTHTLFLLTNHIPHAPSDDYAFWKRILVVPFRLSFVADPQAEFERKEDLYLSEKLKAYAPGILSWLVRGCIEWQRDGLRPPKIVTDATLERKRAEDLIQDFLDDCCFVGDDYSVRATHLYDAFKEWYENNVSKRNPPSQKRFGTAMGKRGFFSDKRDGGYYTYYGIQLKS